MFSVAFAASGLLLTSLALSPAVLFAVAIVSLVAGAALLGRPAVTAAEVEAPRWDLPLRIVVATTLVLLVTGLILVARVPQELAGVEGRTLGIVSLALGLAVLAFAVARRSSFGGPVTIGRRRDG